MRNLKQETCRYILKVESSRSCSQEYGRDDRSSLPEMFYKRCVPKNFIKNTCARVSFLTKLQASGTETLAQVFSCEFCESFRNTFFQRTPPVAVSGRSIWNSVKNLWWSFFSEVSDDWKNFSKSQFHLGEFPKNFPIYPEQPTWQFLPALPKINSLTISTVSTLV